MITKSFNITLDISNGTKRKYDYLLVANDNEVYNFLITLEDNGAKLDLTEIAHVEIKFQKSDGTQVQYSSLDGDRLSITDAINGIISYELGAQEIAYEGPVASEVSLYGANDERITTSQFTFRVRLDIDNENAVTSTNEYSTLIRLLNETEGINAEAVILLPQMQEVIDNNKLIPKPAVPTFADIATTYPTPEVGWIVNVDADSKWYRYDGTTWINTYNYNYDGVTAQLEQIALKQSNDFTTFTNASSTWEGGWFGTGINSGTLQTGTPSYKHKGVLNILSNVSLANSGFRLRTETGAFVLGGNEKTTFLFKTPIDFTGITTRLGFLNTNSHTAPSDGVYCLLNGNQLDGRAVDNSAMSNTITNFTLASDTWYRLVIELNENATIATYTLYQDDSDNVLWQDTINSNIPTIRTVGHGMFSTILAPSAITSIFTIDYMDIVVPSARK